MNAFADFWSINFKRSCRFGAVRTIRGSFSMLLHSALDLARVKPSIKAFKIIISAVA